jgi:hypothetical protein
MPKGKHPVFLIEGNKLWICDTEQFSDELKKRRMILQVAECRDMDLWAER